MSEVGGDRITIDVGPESRIVAGGKDISQVVTTTTTETKNDSPTFTANPQIYLPANLPPTNDTIILYLMGQNQILNKMDNSISQLGSKVEAQAVIMETRARVVETKLEEQNHIWEGKFGKLREMVLGVETTVEGLVRRFKIMEDTSATLEHLSLTRSKQSDVLETKVTTLADQLTGVAQEVKKVADNQSKAKNIDGRALGYAFLLFLLVGLGFFMGLGYLFFRGGG